MATFRTQSEFRNQLFSDIGEGLGRGLEGFADEKLARRKLDVAEKKIEKKDTKKPLKITPKDLETIEAQKTEQFKNLAKSLGYTEEDLENNPDLIQALEAGLQDSLEPFQNQFQGQFTGKVFQPSETAQTPVFSGKAAAPDLNALKPEEIPQSEWDQAPDEDKLIILKERGLL